MDPQGITLLFKADLNHPLGKGKRKGRKTTMRRRKERD